MDLDDRMKAHEEPYRFKVPIRTPVIIRLDGVAFHTKTRGCEKPFDIKLKEAFKDVVDTLVTTIPVRLAYHQSDEISLLLIDYNKFDSEQWYGGIIQKMASVSASIASAEFNYDAGEFPPFGYDEHGTLGFFDSRVFTVPKEDIINYFIWRQRDCRRNAIAGAAQANFSYKELMNVSCEGMIQKLADKGIAFENDYPAEFRNGTIWYRTSTGWRNQAAPIFSDNRGFLEQYLTVEES